MCRTALRPGDHRAHSRCTRHAFLNGRHFVTPQDVKTVAMDVLRHRVSVTYEAEAENVTSKDIVERILNTLPVP